MGLLTLRAQQQGRGLAQSRQSINSGGRNGHQWVSSKTKVVKLWFFGTFVLFSKPERHCGSIAQFKLEEQKQRRQTFKHLVIKTFHFQTHRKAASMWMSDTPWGVFSLQPGTSNSPKKWDFQKKGGFQREKEKGLIFKPAVAHLQVSKRPFYSDRPSGEQKRRNK